MQSSLCHLAPVKAFLPSFGIDRAQPAVETAPAGGVRWPGKQCKSSMHSALLNT